MENEVINMCFMETEDRENEIYSTTSDDDDLQCAFEEMYLELEIFCLKNVYLKKKNLCHENEFNELKEPLKCGAGKSIF